MIADLLPAAVAGIAGGLTVRGLAALGRHRAGVTIRRLVPLEPGARIAEPDGREWRIVGRSFDMAPDRPTTLRVDLVLAEDPS